MSTEDRGFASMDPEEEQEIASWVGKAAHEKGPAHEFTSEDTREAGQQGRNAKRDTTLEEEREKGSEFSI